MEEISKSTILQPLVLIQESPRDREPSSENVCICLFCDHSEKNEKDNKNILRHLYLNHRLIISDVQEVANLQEYLVFWREQFKGKIE